MVDHFVDIGGFVNHPCLNFRFIMVYKTKRNIQPMRIHLQKVQKENVTYQLCHEVWCLMAFFNNITVISWQSVLLVEEPGVP